MFQGSILDSEKEGVTFSLFYAKAWAKNKAECSAVVSVHRVYTPMFLC